jgi:WD40 repeat protein
MRFSAAAGAASRDGMPRPGIVSDGQSAPTNMQESLPAPGRTIPARQIIAAVACLASLTGMMGFAGKWLAPSDALESQESSLALPAVAGSPTVEKRLAISSDGTMLAASEYDRRATPSGAEQSRRMFSRIRLWNLEQGVEGHPLEHPHCSTSMAFSPAGGELVSAGMSPTNEPELKVWEVSSGKLLKRAAVEHSTDAAAVTFSADGTQVLALVGGALRKTLLTWNVSTERETAGAAELTGRPLDAEILAGAFSPSGNLLALSTFHAGNGLRPRIDIYDLSEQRVRRSLSADQSCYGLAFSRDGKLLAAAGSTRIFLWDTATCAEVAAIEHILSPAAHLALSGDGRWLAALDHRNILAVDWRTGTSKPLKPGFSSYEIAFSSADVLIAAPPNSQFAFIDLESGMQVLHSRRTGQ